MSSGKKRTLSQDNDLRPKKKQKLDSKHVKNVDSAENVVDDSDDYDIMEDDLDLDLNIVVGRNNIPLNLSNYNDEMNELPIDEHIHFQYNSHNSGHNILWKNKCVLQPESYSKYQELIINQNYDKYCHFHQPSPKEMLDLYNLSPTSLQNAESVGTILYSIHKSVVCTFSESQYQNRNRKGLERTFTNLDITTIQNIKQSAIFEPKSPEKKNDSSSKTDSNINKKTQSQTQTPTQKQTQTQTQKSKADPMEIDDYGWKDNIFHQLAYEYGISPQLLIRDYLKCNFGATPRIAKAICALLITLNVYEYDKILLLLSTAQNNIQNLHKIDITIPVLHAIYFGLRFDCIRGNSPHFAWGGWGQKIINCGNKLLTEVWNRSHGKGAHFIEHALVGKFRGIIDKINEKIENEADKITILNEIEQKLKIEQIKQDK